jgi:fumarate reductase subunit C
MFLCYWIDFNKHFKAPMHSLRCSWAWVSPNFFSHTTLIPFETCTLCAHSFHYFHGSCTFSYMHFMCTIVLCTCTPNSYKKKIKRKWWKKRSFHHLCDSCTLFFLHSTCTTPLCICTTKNYEQKIEKEWWKKNFIQTFCMSKTTQDEISFMLNCWWRINFTLCRGILKKKGARLELWIVSWANMGFWYHVCTTLWISLICDMELRSKTM